MSASDDKGPGSAHPPGIVVICLHSATQVDQHVSVQPQLRLTFRLYRLLRVMNASDGEWNNQCEEQPAYLLRRHCERSLLCTCCPGQDWGVMETLTDSA